MTGTGMLGVLGGMGPMATVDFLKKLVEATPAARDQDHLGVMVAQAPGIPDRTGAILGEGPDPLPAMTIALRRLEAAGATRIAIPCNTAHHWHGALQALTPVRSCISSMRWPGRSPARASAAAPSACSPRTVPCGRRSIRGA